MNPHSASHPDPRLGLAAILYAGFIVYGSLLPFEFRARSFDEAWHAFQHIPYLRLGLASRADWVANILLYVPLAFLSAGALAGRRGTSWPAVVLAGVLCVGLAFAVEFAQLFFPPRTVSQNDLIAEALGTLIGCILWLTVGKRLLALWHRAFHGGPTAWRAAVVLYTLGYLALSLFPYDFVVSGAELADKLASNRTSFLLAESCGGFLACSVKLGAETLIAAPLGVLLGMLAPHGSPPRYGRALMWGALLGLAIEAAQMLLASGVSQGLSVATRAAGVLWGLVFFHGFRRDWLHRHRRRLKRLALSALPVYLVLVLALNGVIRSGVEPTWMALQKLADLHLLPFYYHYYTTETEAMQSLLVNAGAYAPLGVFAWILSSGRRRAHWPLLLTAALLAFAVEAAKLFVAGKRPDPTNILIGTAAAWLVWALLARLEQGADLTAAHDTATPPATKPGRPRLKLAALGTVAAVALGGWVLARQPAERAVDEAALPQLPPGVMLPRADLPRFRLAHPRLPHPASADFALLRRHNPGYLEQRRREAAGGAGPVEAVGFMELAEPGSQNLQPLHDRLMALKFGWRGHEQVKPLALAYDWLHARWSPAQREALRGKLAEGCEYVIGVIRNERLSPYNVILYNSPFQALVACAIALYRDDPRSEPVMRFTYDLWKNRVLPAWRQIMGRNGGWHEGGEYVGIGIGQAIWQVPAMWREATGEDVFAADPGIRGFLDFLVYRTRPDGTHFRWGDGAYFDRAVPDLAPLAIEYRHAAAYTLRPPAKGAPVPTGWPWGPFSDDTLIDPQAASRLPLTRLFDGIGLAVARSDWSPEATYVTFKAGDNYWSHVHLDQGAFTIDKGGPLAIDSGLYGPKYGSDHHMNYSYQAIAHNVVTVTDPEDTVPAPARSNREKPRPIANDGGQRRIGSGWGVEAAPLDPDEWNAKADTYRTGRIVEFFEGDGLTVAAADLTPAFTNAQSGKGTFSHRTRRVERWWRVFAYDRIDDALVIYDEVIAADPAMRKRWLLHTIEPPRIEGRTFSVEIAPQPRPGRAGGRLDGQILLPKQATLNAIGGKGFEFYVDGRNYDEGGRIQQIARQRGPGGPEPGAWRIELSPERDARQDSFLVVLLPTGSGQAAKPRVRLIESEGRVGCEIAGRKRTTRWYFEPGRLATEIEVEEAGARRSHRLGTASAAAETQAGGLDKALRRLGLR